MPKSLSLSPTRLTIVVLLRLHSFKSPPAGVGLIISRLKRHRSVFSLYDDLEKKAEEITVHWRESCSLLTSIMLQICGGCLKIVLANSGFTQSLANNFPIAQYSNCCAAEDLSSFFDRGGRRGRERVLTTPE